MKFYPKKKVVNCSIPLLRNENINLVSTTPFIEKFIEKC